MIIEDNKENVVSGYPLLTQEQIDMIIDTTGIERLHYEGHEREEFKQIIFDNFRFPDLVSSYGRILSLRYKGNYGKISFLKPKLRKSGYHEICLIANGKTYWKLVHRLVGDAFIVNPYNKKEINHKDGVKTNNYTWNLEWCTPKENIRHLYKHGLKKNILQGESITDSIYTEKQIREVCEFIQAGFDMDNIISKKTGVSVGMIRHIRKGRSWKHISSQYGIKPNYSYNKIIDYLHD